jgi:hypothetical protein
MKLEGNGRQLEVSNVHQKPDPILAAYCVASLIFVLPLFVIGVTVVLFSIAVAGEIAGRVRGRDAGLVDTRTIAIGMCTGAELPKQSSLRTRIEGV